MGSAPLFRYKAALLVKLKRSFLPPDAVAKHTWCYDNAAIKPRSG